MIDIKATAVNYSLVSNASFTVTRCVLYEYECTYHASTVVLSRRCHQSTSGTVVWIDSILMFLNDMTDILYLPRTRTCILFCTCTTPYTMHCTALHCTVYSVLYITLTDNFWNWSATPLASILRFLVAQELSARLHSQALGGGGGGSEWERVTRTDRQSNQSPERGVDDPDADCEDGEDGARAGVRRMWAAAARRPAGCPAARFTCHLCQRGRATGRAPHTRTARPSRSSLKWSSLFKLAIHSIIH